MAATATEVEVAQFLVTTALLDRRDCRRVHNVDEHHRKHPGVPGPVVSMAIRRVARKTSHKPPRRIDRPMGERHWRRLSHALVPVWRDHLVAGYEVLAPQFAGELAGELSADQLGFA